MSTTLTKQADSEAALREQIERQLASHRKSGQAHGDPWGPRHDDGEDIYKDFGILPMHRYLEQEYRAGKSIAGFPSAFVNPVVHVRERDIQVVEEIDVEYDPDDPHPSHDFLAENYPPLRAKMLEWLAVDDISLPGPGRRKRADVLTDKGTDIHIYGQPGSGKSTLACFLTLAMQQVNNETVLWADTLDESGVNERAEWLPLAPWTTIALPEGFPVRVRVVPENPAVGSFEVPLEAICRDVIRYESPRDLNQQLMPGQFYVVYPDPLLRGCEAVSRYAYHSYEAVTPEGEPGPNEPTPVNHWWFAYIATRITHDDYLHFTTINIDEAGNLLDPDVSRDAHDSYDKVVWLKDKYADARKKGVTFLYQTHALSEIHQKIRAKMRTWLTMNGSSPPLGRTLPGEKQCPMNTDLTSSMPKGQGVIWNTNNFADVVWPNLKRKRSIDAELSVEFPTWGEVR